MATVLKMLKKKSEVVTVDEMKAFAVTLKKHYWRLLNDAKPVQKNGNDLMGWNSKRTLGNIMISESKSKQAPAQPAQATTFNLVIKEN